jgi:hypothetical protein
LKLFGRECVVFYRFRAIAHSKDVNVVGKSVTAILVPSGS